MADGIVTLAVVMAVTAAIGWWWLRRQGAVRTRPGTDARDWTDQGVLLGARATFVQLSAAVCAPCRATARVLGELANAHPGVTHRELDVDENLDLVRELSVLRTPTVLVLDPAGREVARMSGVVSRRQANEALGTVDHQMIDDGRTRT
ncbi:thioredoxin family protein [Antribacter gilvus]|uniref:thioredoxin family protein n=1 Tax=Antribacter gilvus TaxID=2304675 RepID=UPI000F76E0F5|nr:thioredoxin family protein [Antribacter gilvus]